MTILAIYVSKHYRTGGQKRYIEVLRGLALKNHKIYLFHREDRVFSEIFPDNFHTIPMQVHKGYSQQKAFTKSLKRLPQNYLESLHCNRIFLFGDSSLHCGIFLKKKLGIPLIMALRNNSYVADRVARKVSPKNILIDRRNRIREAQFCHHADTLVFQSEYDRNSLTSRNSLPQKRTHIVPNSVRASWFEEEWRHTNDSHKLENLLFIGSDSKRKGLSFLLKALQGLKNRDYDFSLTLVGDYPRTNINTLPDWVIHKGRLDSTLDILSQSDLLIVPSLYDSFPNTVLESLYVGTPVVGTAVAGIMAMLEDESLLFGQADSNDIMKTLEPLFNQENYKKAKNICRERLTHFDFDWIAPWETLLKKESI